MGSWVNESVFYHIYPLGFCGAPLLNAGSAPVNRIEKVLEWLPHLKEMGINAVYFGPVFESTVHGYDTRDYRMIDRRLGSNEDFKRVCAVLHENHIRVVLDGVFNHVGRDFWAFKDVQANERQSPYADWFANINFYGTSPYGDPFSYEGWNGHMNLIKLNLRSSGTAEYLLESVKMWIEEFGIDGLRLDAADCVDDGFFRRLRTFTKELRPDFWLMGEIIHGDYRRWANPEMLDSVTNYECHKGLYSSHNDRNYFEIAYSLNRQFGPDGIYKDLTLYSFVDNHDVDRIASKLANPEHIFNVHTLLYAMPGVPSVYYGSEWGIPGERSDSSDDALRPSLQLGGIIDPNQKLLEHICNLGRLRKELSALQYGSYEQVIVRNEQFVFKRSCNTQAVYAAFNLAEYPETLTFEIAGTALTDRLSGTEICAESQQVTLTIPPYSSMLLVEETNCGEKARVEKQGVVLGGKYRHFKGGEYIAIDVGRHSETLEDMVIYRALGGSGGIWVRPLAMFLSDVEDSGQTKRRFEYIG